MAKIKKKYKKFFEKQTPSGMSSERKKENREN